MPDVKRLRLSPWPYLIGLCLLIGPSSRRAVAQSAEEMMGVKEGHCSLAQGTVDGKTFACMVWDNDPAKFSNPTQIEVYRGRKLVFTIQGGAPIDEWHFWQEGQRLAVHYGTNEGPDIYVLYDARTGTQLVRVTGTSQPRMLPQWAKSPSQLAQESLPEGSAFSLQETLWIDKVLSEINTIHAGMTRKDLLKVFRGKGGLSTRTQRTYVYRECPYIKVNATFSVVGTPGMDESDDDRLISISGPYLAYSVMD